MKKFFRALYLILQAVWCVATLVIGLIFVALPVAYHTGAVGHRYPETAANIAGVIGFVILWPAAKAIYALLYSTEKHVSVVQRQLPISLAVGQSSVKTATAK